MTDREACERLCAEVTELLRILEAREQLDAGFEGMGVNILIEKAGKLRSQSRRVNRLLSELGAGL